VGISIVKSSSLPPTFYLKLTYISYNLFKKVAFIVLIDNHQRVINYLRISVTQRCNFRCLYCMSEKPFSWVPQENLLSFEELFVFIKMAIDSGVDKIRLTGGEPLLRDSVDKLVSMIYSYAPQVDLCMTTNAYLLKHLAKRLRDAGLKRVNISLDSLDQETMKQIAKKDVLSQVLDGIDEAIRVGLKIKINTVILQGINEHEVLDLFEYAKSREIEIRYIEYMQNSFAKDALVGLSSPKILDVLSKKYHFDDDGYSANSPSHYYRLDDGYRFGMIEPHRDDFCTSCNRLRLTAEGDLIPCLYFDESMSIKKHVKSGDIKSAAKVLQDVIGNRALKNRWSDDESSNRAFYETGG